MSLPPSKRRKALELCRRLLADLDGERVRASTAVQRLYRIARLAGYDEVGKKARAELEGYPSDAWSADGFAEELRQLADRDLLDPEVDFEALAEAGFVEVPTYRRLSLVRYDPYDFGRKFGIVVLPDPVAKCEELLERSRRERGKTHLIEYRERSYELSVAELNKLVSGVKGWVYSEASRIEEHLEFGEIPTKALETTFDFVDSQLLELVPRAAERLIAAYRNLAERNEENWINVADRCRRVIKDFADAVFPPQNKEAYGLVVTEVKYLNRLRAFIRGAIESRRQRKHVESVLKLLGELLAKTDNLASRSVHAGEVSRFEAERILIYTYLCIGDILVLTGLGERADATTERINLNTASLDELRTGLGLSARVAGELLRRRKYRELTSWDEVAEVKGIGPKTLGRLRDLASL